MSFCKYRRSSWKLRVLVVDDLTIKFSLPTRGTRRLAIYRADRREHGRRLPVLLVDEGTGFLIAVQPSPAAIGWRQPRFIRNEIQGTQFNVHIHTPKSVCRFHVEMFVDRKSTRLNSS